MPRINFKSRFADAVESGRQRMTLFRNTRGLPKPGDRLTFYSGPYNQLRKLGESTCLLTMAIWIDRWQTFNPDSGGYGEQFPDFGDTERATIIRACGWRGLDDLLEFVDKQYGRPFLPFFAELVIWEPIVTAIPDTPDTVAALAAVERVKAEIIARYGDYEKIQEENRHNFANVPMLYEGEEEDPAFDTRHNPYEDDLNTPEDADED